MYRPHNKPGNTELLYGGGRVGKDIRRRLKGKNIELILQNVWNRKTLTEDFEENFLEIFLCYDRFTRGPL